MLTSLFNLRSYSYSTKLSYATQILITTDSMCQNKFLIRVNSQARKALEVLLNVLAIKEENIMSHLVVLILLRAANKPTFLDVLMDFF